mmetsp:Transcript_32746/g.81121  ORF Transcript_32746/g.81121 Transcript_32746/m.81121 type:complete len:313 (-) Transcript_32746:121-1059(-)
MRLLKSTPGNIAEMPRKPADRSINCRERWLDENTSSSSSARYGTDELSSRMLSIWKRRSSTGMWFSASWSIRPSGVRINRRTQRALLCSRFLSRSVGYPRSLLSPSLVVSSMEKHEPGCRDASWKNRQAVDAASMFSNLQNDRMLTTISRSRPGGCSVMPSTASSAAPSLPVSRSTDVASSLAGKQLEAGLACPSPSLGLMSISVASLVGEGEEDEMLVTLEVCRDDVPLRERSTISEGSASPPRMRDPRPLSSSLRSCGWRIHSSKIWSPERSSSRKADKWMGYVDAPDRCMASRGERDGKEGGISGYQPR